MEMQAAESNLIKTPKLRWLAREAGYADYSNHVYLGHTTGITTSSRPVIAPGETAELREGSFLNVEPGIYFEGKTGMRRCDVVHLAEDRLEVLT